MHRLVPLIKDAFNDKKSYAEITAIVQPVMRRMINEVFEIVIKKIRLHNAQLFHEVENLQSYITLMGVMEAVHIEQFAGILDVDSLALLLESTFDFSVATLDDYLHAHCFSHIKMIALMRSKVLYDMKHSLEGVEVIYRQLLFDFRFGKKNVSNFSFSRSSMTHNARSKPTICWQSCRRLPLLLKRENCT